MLSFVVIIHLYIRSYIGYIINMSHNIDVQMKNMEYMLAS